MNISSTMFLQFFEPSLPEVVGLWNFIINSPIENQLTFYSRRRDYLNHLIMLIFSSDRAVGFQLVTPIFHWLFRMTNAKWVDVKWSVPILSELKGV